MQILIYGFLGGAVVVALVVAIILGGWFWLMPGVIVPIVAVYAVFDRRLKRRQGRGERLSSELHPDR